MRMKLNYFENSLKRAVSIVLYAKRAEYTASNWNTPIPGMPFLT